MECSPLPHKPSSFDVEARLHFSSKDKENINLNNMHPPLQRSSTNASTSSTISNSSLTSLNSLSSASSTTSLCSNTSDSEDLAPLPFPDYAADNASRPTFPRKNRIKSLSNVSYLIGNTPLLSWDSSQQNLSPENKDKTSSPGINSFFSCSPMRRASSAQVQSVKDSKEDTNMLSFGGPPPSISTRPRSTGFGSNRALRTSTTVSIPSTSATSSSTVPALPPSSSFRYTKVRRTQSMFQHPADILADEIKEEIQLSPPSSSASVSSGSPGTGQSFLTRPDCPIKTFSVEGDPFQRIDRHTLCEILDGRYNQHYDKHVLVDCRFEYEYEGGHIEGAININSKDKLEAELLRNMPDSSKRLLLIFHCEYSAHRGPRMAMHLRNCDRHINMNRYPELHYPDIVILQGGYSQFFERFYNRCEPQRYVEMNDSEHKKTCEREMDRFRRNMKVGSLGGSLAHFKFPLDSQTPSRRCR